MTNEQAKNYTRQLLQHYPFTYCPTLANKTTNRTPHKGDVVLFWNGSEYSHTGYVYATDSTRFYTIEGNTSGASGIIANGGGVCKKSYYTSSYSSSKFFRPNYSILVSAGIFKTTDAAINAIISIANNEVGYLEKRSNASLDNKTANAGSNNYTKYWRDIYSAYQAQPWCACFVTWIIQMAILYSGSTVVTTPSSTTTNTTTASTAKVGTYSSIGTWKNGTTDEIVYADTSRKVKVGSMNPYESTTCIGKLSGSYILIYKIDGTSHYKVGAVEYAGGISSSNAGTVKGTWKNGSTDEIVYADTSKKVKVGSLNPYEVCDCLGMCNGMYIVRYKIDGTSHYKVGLVAYSGGL